MECRQKTSKGFLTMMMAALVMVNAYAQEDDAEINEDLEAFTVVGHDEIREMREATMPISVISLTQLEGTATNINDALARTTGITVRNTGGVGSASRISVRGLEGKRMGIS